MKKLALTAALLAATLAPAPAAVVITEVDPSGSGTATYAADWFELTNTGTAPVDLTGWKMDDNSNSFSLSVGLRGVSSLAPGRSVVFIESDAAGANDATVEAAFKAAWFGANVPSTFTIGAYGGSGVGLSTGGDAVNVFTAAGTLVANESFGTATTNVSFDNAQGLNNATISQLSQPGVRGAFTSPTSEVGSPGVVPEPGTWSLLLGGAGALLLGACRRATRQHAMQPRLIGNSQSCRG